MRKTFQKYNHELDPVNQGMPAPGKYIHVIVIIIKYIYMGNTLEKCIMFFASKFHLLRLFHLH